MGIPYFHIDLFQRNFDLFRKCAEKNGYTADPEQMGWLLPIYVAETDEQAWAEYEKHLWYFANNLLKGLDDFAAWLHQCPIDCRNRPREGPIPEHRDHAPDRLNKAPTPWSAARQRCAIG